MSLFMKITFYVLLPFLVQASNPSDAKMLTLVTAEMKTLERLADKTNLSLKDWMDFQNEIDQKCEVENDDERKEAYCMFFFSINHIGESFNAGKTPRTFTKGCRGVENTTRLMAEDEKITQYLDKVVAKLCPQK